MNNQSSKDDELKRLKVSSPVQKFMKKYRYQYSRQMVTDLAELIHSEKQKSELETLEGLMEWQEQPTDLDGRPVGKPVHHLCPNCIEVIGMEVEALKETKGEKNE